MQRSLFLLLLGPVLGLLAPLASAQGRGNGGPVPVVLAQAESRKVAARRSFVGTIRPTKRAVLGSEIQGLVVAFHARAGRRVTPRDVLAQLRTTTIDSRVAAARAVARLREQELAEAENGSRPEEIAVAQAQVGQAEAELEIRKWKLETAERLYRDKTVTEDELQDARLLARVAAKRLEQEKASLALLEAGTREERIAQARARLDAAKAEVERLESDKRLHEIHAPFAGWVAEERTEVGQWLGTGESIAVLVSLDEVDVVVPVLEDFVAELAPGRVVPVTIDALPGRPFQAELVAVVPQADERARSFPVKLRLKNEVRDGQPLLMAGMLARVYLDTGSKRTAILVPKDALVLGEARPQVWVVDDSMTAKPVPVVPGLAVGESIEIASGLEEGQKVVVRGNERLKGTPKVREVER